MIENAKKNNFKKSDLEDIYYSLYIFLYYYRSLRTASQNKIRAFYIEIFNKIDHTELRN